MWVSIDEFLLESFRWELPPDEMQIFAKYYCGYMNQFPQYTRSHYARQTREAMSIINSSAGIRVLEVGAGCGTEALWFAMNGATVVSLDLNMCRLRVAKRRQKILEEKLGRSLPVQFQFGSFFDLNAKNAYDLVWMEQTFHHLEPRSDVGGQIYNVLTPNGACIISEVNGTNVLLQAQLIKKRGFNTIGRYVDELGIEHQYGNERITTPRKLTSLLTDAGFTDITVNRFRTLPNVDVPSCVIRAETKLVAVAPFLATHFNLCARKPIEQLKLM